MGLEQAFPESQARPQDHAALSNGLVHLLGVSGRCLATLDRKHEPISQTFFNQKGQALDRNVLQCP